MEIENIWKRLASEDSLSESEIKGSLRLKNQDVLRKINRRLLWKIIFTLLFTPIYAALVFYLEDWFPQLLFSVLVLTHLVALVFFFKRYQKARNLHMSSESVVETLKLYRDNVRSTIKLEELSGLAIYPIAAAAGFFFSLMEKMTWEQALQEKIVWIVLLISVIIITPLAHLLARWMNRKTFGSLLNRLDRRIEELEEI